jgi:hypothetical protein
MSQVVDAIRAVVRDVNLDAEDPRRGKIFFLHNEMVLHDDTFIIGTTLWTDVHDHESSAHYINDYNFITGFTPAECTSLFRANYSFIKSCLDVVEERKRREPSIRCMVITHHLPSFGVVHEKYSGMTHLTPFFAAPCDALIGPPVDYWIYGHTHKANEHVINGVRVLCNPKGYAKEDSGYDSSKCVEL